MPLELANLRAVLTAARLGSFSRAAEALNITQPALSRRIAEAESALEVRLFERRPRGVQATDACLAFIGHAETALNSIENGREAARETENLRLSEATFGFLENLCDDVLTSACRSTLEEVAGATINFRPRALSADLTADLLAGSTELGLRYRRDPDPQLASLWVADDPIAVACAASHPLGRTGVATMNELEEAQWIGSAANLDDTAMGSVEDFYSRWRAMTMVPIFARLKLVEAGFGLAIVRRAALREAIDRGSIVALKTPLELSLPIYLVWRRGARLSRAAEHLRENILRLYSPNPADDSTGIKKEGSGSRPGTWCRN